MSYKICNVSYEGNYIPLYDYPYERTDENVFTVLIGKNGSGKSRVLSAIANTLCSVFVGNKLLKRDIGAGSKYRQEDHYFSIKIISGNDIQEIEIKGRSISSSFRTQYEKNKFCPKKIITVSTSPFDKFPEERVYFSSKINDDDYSFYNYYGLNESSKNKAVLSLIEKLFFSTAKGSLNKDQYTIPKVLSFLGFESRFELHFRLKHGINKFMDNLYEMNRGQFMTYTQLT